MALATVTIPGFSGSTQAVLGGSSFQISGSTRMTTATVTGGKKAGLARHGLSVRAEQVTAAEQTPTSRRSMLGLVAAGLFSGSFAANAALPSGVGLSFLQRKGDMEALAAETKPIKVAAISGSLSKTAVDTGLLRAAIKISNESIKDLQIELVDISNLPILNTDLEVDKTYPSEVEAFRQKVSAADSLLFATPEYCYSVSGALKNAIDWGSRPANVWADKAAAILTTGYDLGGGRAQYHLRQIGVYNNIHFINTPELFINSNDKPPKFDKNGDLTDTATKEKVKEILESLLAFARRLQA